MKLNRLLFLLKGGDVFRKTEPLPPQGPGIQRQLNVHRNGILRRKLAFSFHVKKSG